MAVDLQAVLEKVGGEMLGAARQPVERLELVPTIARRVAVTLLALPVVGVAVASGAWIVAGVTVVAYVATCVAFGRLRVVVDRDGIHAGRRTLAWSAIDHYTYTSSLPRGFVQIGQGNRLIRANAASSTRHDLLVVGTDGSAIRIDSHFRRAEHAVSMILVELHRRLADRASFAPFALEDDGLHHARKGVLPWTKLEVVAVDGQTPPRIHLKAHGKAFPWVTEHAPSVCNTLLFLERLAERGISLELNQGVLVHDQLDALLQRRAAMPRAEVVERR
ncbi:MAG: hypothetical protein SFX73_16185 [Kofleriaceae bacterium]|nr:hypothetical protein [Kofleriaceae bacterium]